MQASAVRFPPPSPSLSRRRGAAAFEAAVALPVFLLILFGLLDLSLAILRRNSLCECARRAARLAIVRGEKASSPLGPAGWSGTGADDHPVTDAIRGLLTTMPPDRVRVEILWPDSGNRVGQRLQVRLRFAHESVLSGLFGMEPWNLSAISTMRIAH